jgi:hypothetical protein
VETMVEAMEEEEATMEATAVEEEEDGGDLYFTLCDTFYFFRVLRISTLPSQ